MEMVHSLSHIDVYCARYMWSEVREVWWPKNWEIGPSDKKKKPTVILIKPLTLSLSKHI